MNILLVDDDLEIRETLSELLEEMGHRVLVASSGEDALGLVSAQASAIELVLLDLQMPGMDGWELARRLAPLRVPLIVTTGTHRPTLTFEAAGVLVKPFRLRDLLGLIERVASQACVTTP